MTPEPTGGYYKDAGVEAFIRKFGYTDQRGRQDRMNFGGIHRVGERHHNTGLTMIVTGYDAVRQIITDSSGNIALVSDRGVTAASWAFGGILEHWSRKHTKAVYIPSLCRKEPSRQYRYADRVRLAQKTDSLLLLHALVEGTVYYDPGIKLENASGKPVTKRRSQFRIASKSVDSLYKTVDLIEL